MKKQIYSFKSTLGLTFLEVIITIVLYTIAFLGVFQVTNVSLQANKRVQMGYVGSSLATGLMSEILTKDFIDPTDPSTALGPNGVEAGRSTFDDVDDYEAYSENPPMTIGGINMDSSNPPDYSEFTRSVDVYYCENQTGVIVEIAGPPYNWKCLNVTVDAPSYRAISYIGIKVQP